MTDSFIQQLEIEYATNKPWRVLPLIFTEVREQFVEVEGASAEKEITYRGLSRDSKHFRRKSLVELETAFSANHADMLAVNTTIFGDLIKLHVGSHHFPDGRVKVEIQVASDDRLRTERVARNLMVAVGEATKLGTLALDAHVTLEDIWVRSSDDGEEEEPAGATGQSETSPSSVPAVAAGASSPTGTWFREKWRDHAATLVVTVIGGVVVAIAILLFGLAPKQG